MSPAITPCSTRSAAEKTNSARSLSSRARRTTAGVVRYVPSATARAISRATRPRSAVSTEMGTPSWVTPRSRRGGKRAASRSSSRS